MSQIKLDPALLSRSLEAVQDVSVHREHEDGIIIRFKAYVGFVPQAFEQPNVRAQLLIRTSKGDRRISGRLNASKSSGLWHSYVFHSCWQAEVAHVCIQGQWSNLREVIIVTDEFDCRVPNGFFRSSLAGRLLPFFS